MNRLIPRQPVPDLAVPLVGGDTWRLSEKTPETFIMIAFYRGLHCPICRGWLGGLQKAASEFAERGVEILAVSMDAEDRASTAKADWRLPDVPLCFALPETSAREWGLYFSEGMGGLEPLVFSEPGLFIVNPNRELYFASTQTMPFTRPAFSDLVGAVDYAVEHEYPARGEWISG